MQTQYRKKISAIVGVVFAFTLVVSPVFIYGAASPQTQAGNTGLTYECGDNVAGGTKTAGNCDFADLMAAVKNVVNKGTLIALSLSVIAIVYAGFNYMISGDNPSKRGEANKTLLNVVKGIAFILAAWLIVTLITSALLRTGIIQFGP